MRVQQEQEASKRLQSTAPAFGEALNMACMPSSGLARSVRGKLSPSAVLSLQQTLGNAAVCRMLATQRRPVLQRQDDDSDDDDTANTGPVDSQPEASQPDDSQSDNSEPGAKGSDDSPPEVEQPDDSRSDDNDSDNEQPTADNSNDPDTDNATDDSDTESGTPNLQPVTKTVGPLTLHGAFAEATGTATDNPSGNLTINSAAYQDQHDGTTKVTGQATATFAANVSISLPSVPDEITDPCERAEYQKAINTTLDAHEKQHKKLYEQFDGSVTSSFSEVGNTVPDGQDMPDVTAALSAKLVDPPMDRSDPSSRLSKAEAASGAIDPFNLNVDMSKCNKTP